MSVHVEIGAAPLDPGQVLSSLASPADGAVNLFLGGWHFPIAAVGPSVFWFMGKVGIVLFIFIWLRGTLPRFRYDQLMALGWKVLIPVVTINIMLTAMLVAAGWL